jgi:hypothetical protein
MKNALIAFLIVGVIAAFCPVKADDDDHRDRDRDGYHEEHHEHYEHYRHHRHHHHDDDDENHVEIHLNPGR